MRVVLASARVALRDLAGIRAVALHVAAVAATWLLARLTGGSTPSGAWMVESPLLALPLWLPGLWVALRARDAWPALGPSDSATPFVFVHGRSLLAPRAGVVLGTVGALVLLQLLTGVLVGAAASAARGAPEFRIAHELRAATNSGAPPLPLIRAGQHDDFDLKAPAAGASLRIEPRYYFSVASTRAGVTFEVRDGARVLARDRLHDFGANVTVALPPDTGATTLSIVRTSDTGPALSFAKGRVLLETARPPSVVAGAVIALHPLRWALTLLLGALASAPFLALALHKLVVLGSAPLVALVPFAAGTGARAGAEKQLLSGLAVVPEVPASASLLPLLGMLLLAILPLRRQLGPFDEIIEE